MTDPVNIGIALLTIFFGLSLMYSVMGAIISGSILNKEQIHPCFMCLFSCAVPASMIGLGFTWFGHFPFAIRLMVALLVFLVSVSYCAQHTSKSWPHL